MICFTLVCAAEHEFEGWFRDGDSFGEQVAGGQVGCPTCGCTQVRKGVMAPAIARGQKMATGEQVPSDVPEHVKATVARHMLRKLREHVEANFDHVGERFAEEARRIHYGDSEKRDIWGKATPAEARALDDEGIQVRPLPEVPEADS